MILLISVMLYGVLGVILFFSGVGALEKPLHFFLILLNVAAIEFMGRMRA